MTTTLITGANKGLGFETARRLRAEGHDVWVAARDPERGRAAAQELGARFVALDVTDDAAVAAAVQQVAAPVIVNVSSGMGSLAVTSDPERLESTLVSLTYPSSKTALNMITSQYAKALPDFRVNAVDPGYTATDLNGHRGTKTVQQGAEALVRMAKIGPDGPTGTFVDEHGIVAW